MQSKKVKKKCKVVIDNSKASDASIEYKIEDLKDDEFETISFGDILSGIVNAVDKRVGE